MGKVCLLRDTWERFLDVAKDLDVGPHRLASYLVLDHSEIASESSSAYIKSFEIKPHMRDLSTARLAMSAHAKLIDLSMALDIRMYAILTAILEDNMPTLQVLPDTFSGLKHLHGRRRINVTKHISIDQSVYDWICRRARVQSVEREQDITPADYAESILTSLDFTVLAEKIDTGLITEAIIRDNTESSSKGRSLRVSPGVYEMIDRMAKSLNVSKKTMLSFLIRRELKASELEITLNRQLLPSDLQKRWTFLLQEFLQDEPDDPFSYK